MRWIKRGAKCKYMTVGIFNNLFRHKNKSKQMNNVIKTEFTAELGT